MTTPDDVVALIATAEARARSEERERCARVCEERADRSWTYWVRLGRSADRTAATVANELAAAIRKG